MHSQMLRPRVEEKLFSTVVLLLKKCYSSGSVTEEYLVPDSLKNYLQQLCSLSTLADEENVSTGHDYAVRANHRSDAKSKQAAIYHQLEQSGDLQREFRMQLQPFFISQSSQIQSCGQRTQTGNPKLIPNPRFPKNMGGLIASLKTWRRRLQRILACAP